LAAINPAPENRGTRAAGAVPLNPYWNDILEAVRQRVSQQTFDTWFHPLLPGECREGMMEVLCPNRFFMDWFSEHHLSTLDEVSSAHFGRETSCSLAVDAAQAAEAEDLLVGPEAGVLRDRAAEPGMMIAEGPPARGGSSLLNPAYTFESFVVGSGSKLAHAAAVAVSRNLGGSYNPLFIHGGVGLGKTHLMHAIGNAIHAQQPGKKICCVTAEHFMNDLIRSIQQNRTHEFKRDYRGVDVLLVDDVAFLAGKESTQEEFFHTFNALHGKNKQIVLTSDRPPKEITTLEERLRSRFEWGLITDIQAPDLETRIAILKKKVEVNNIYISDDVIEYIAENITTNIRKLEGALIRLLAFASLTGNEISLEMASETLSSYFQASPARIVSIADVASLVADRFHVTVDQLKSKKRTQDVALARQVAMYVARETVGASLSMIGRAFGNRDHTTVMHACHKVSLLCNQDPKFRGRIKDLLSEL
jgi:chromosomal replication initiator protein